MNIFTTIKRSVERRCSEAAKFTSIFFEKICDEVFPSFQLFARFSHRNGELERKGEEKSIFTRSNIEKQDKTRQEFAMCENRAKGFHFPQQSSHLRCRLIRRRRVKWNGKSRPVLGGKLKKISSHVRPSGFLARESETDDQRQLFWGHEYYRWFAYMWLIRRRCFAPGSLGLFRFTTVELQWLLGARLFVAVATSAWLLTSFPVEVNDQVPNWRRLCARWWQNVKHLV